LGDPAEAAAAHWLGLHQSGSSSSLTHSSSTACHAHTGT
jgi:hypothetical protein